MMPGDLLGYRIAGVVLFLTTASLLNEVISTWVVSGAIPGVGFLPALGAFMALLLGSRIQRMMSVVLLLFAIIVVVLQCRAQLQYIGG
jgi:hypothetical protein